MQTADLKTIMQIEQRSLPTPWSEAGYIHELTQNPLAVYQVVTQQTDQGPTICAYGGHWLLVDEAHISIIATDPPFRRRGLGALLLSSMLYIALKQNAQLATLEVRRSNVSAQALYRKYGFEQVGVRLNYYKDTHEDGLIMTAEPLDNAYASLLEQRRLTLLAQLQQAWA
jgi:ribosomal-protein-alanine N-acetyltransferase